MWRFMALRMCGHLYGISCYSSNALAPFQQFYSRLSTANTDTFMLDMSTCNLRHVIDCLGFMNKQILLP